MHCHENSGPQMWAWVQIPLLTNFFFEFFSVFAKNNKAVYTAASVLFFWAGPVKSFCSPQKSTDQWIDGPTDG